MLNVDDLSSQGSTFRAAEVDTLAQAYRFALAYLDASPTLSLAERRFLLQTIIRGGAERLCRNETLETFIDAHALAAEVVGFYLHLESF